MTERKEAAAMEKYEKPCMEIVELRNEVVTGYTLLDESGSELDTIS